MADQSRTFASESLPGRCSAAHDVFRSMEGLGSRWRDRHGEMRAAGIPELHDGVHPRPDGADSLGGCQHALNRGGSDEWNGVASRVRNCMDVRPCGPGADDSVHVLPVFRTLFPDHGADQQLGLFVLPGIRTDVRVGDGKKIKQAVQLPEGLSIGRRLGGRNRHRRAGARSRGSRWLPRAI